MSDIGNVVKYNELQKVWYQIDILPCISQQTEFKVHVSVNSHTRIDKLHAFRRSSRVELHLRHGHTSSFWRSLKYHNLEFSKHEGSRLLGYDAVLCWVIISEFSDRLQLFSGCSHKSYRKKEPVLRIETSFCTVQIVTYFDLVLTYLSWLRFFYPDWGFSTLTEVFLPWLRFFRAFSSVVRQMPGYN